MSEGRCQYQIIKQTHEKIIKINCRKCDNGNATILDENCRSNILSLLQKEQGVTKLILNHVLIKVFEGENLERLQQLTRFIEELELFGNLTDLSKQYEYCDSCIKNRRTIIETIIHIAKDDPIKAYQELKALEKKTTAVTISCSPCEKSFNHMITKLLQEIPEGNLLPEKHGTHDFYTTMIRPYVRPGFIESYIQPNPPSDAVFLETYTIEGNKDYPTTITLYQLKNKPEKMYFMLPPEFELPREELLLLEKLRKQLIHHRPEDPSFMDSETARDYFKHFAKKMITTLIRKEKLNVDTDKISYLSNVFSRYTAGFGILDILLSDQRVQDIYVNAPVANNPLHLVLNGEEYTSNIFLSAEDVEAFASRFRTLSGRAFSEAAPVLDMDLEHYHTRVAAINNPLTPQGIAFVLRKHREKPWTLAHFIANNMISAYTAGLLSFLVDGQASILIAGSRGAGKTSLLSALLLEIPQRYRILTIEDTAEIPVDVLQKKGYKIQSLITKSIASRTQSLELDPTDALRTALRLGESVLIIGEVRGNEAKVLFEAMRVGAAGNLIMGTIHGSTTRDVYERIVYDIGVPPTSFKAVDAVIITAPIRYEGGLERKRRVTQISEITRSPWDTNPNPDVVFQNLMMYDTEKDMLLPTDLLDKGQSEVIQHIAKKWGITVEKALQNIQLRAFIKQTIVEFSKENKELLEAETVRDANNAFWMFIEESRTYHEQVDYGFVKTKWYQWFMKYVG